MGERARLYEGAYGNSFGSEGGQKGLFKSNFDVNNMIFYIIVHELR